MTDPQAAEAETIRAAIESLAEPNWLVGLGLSEPLAEWLRDALEGDDHNVINPYAVAVANVLINPGAAKEA